ncbi:DNA polymerase IV, partial [bacterium]|nr:DNA polymerase IV [bacterium]
MDSFYASVEVRDRPSLRGKPVAVGGAADSRGVVSSASYEARRYGVRSAMPMATALRRCPELIVIGGEMAKYQDVSRKLRKIFDAFSPRVEPLSLDEAFLDLTGSEKLLGGPREIGEAIRRRIHSELSLTGSVGIAPSKFVAKLASDHDKPDGLTIVPPGGERAFVQSLPLEWLWGVGPSTLQG